MASINYWLHRLVSLDEGTDAEGTIASIRAGIVLRGVGVWMLVCSALLASIGLDLNSTAVIIGAMLISPLMSPILGVGLSVATFDRSLLWRSLKHLVFAIILSLGASFVYFSLTPFGELTAELSSRTTPTLLDVAVAFVGGIAGIVSGSRREKGNAIPGVAIATALMPPLCTAGFGLAKGQLEVFLGGFYLFFINAVFIALATYLTAAFLRFPRFVATDESNRWNVRWLVVAFAVVTVIPSVVILVGVINKVRFDNAVRRFVSNEIKAANQQPIQWEILNRDSNAMLRIYTVGDSNGEHRNNELKQKLIEYAGQPIELEIVPLKISPDEFRRMSTDLTSGLAAKVGFLERLAEERAAELAQLRQEVGDFRTNLRPENQLSIDLRAMFPEITNVSVQTVRTPSDPATTAESATATPGTDGSSNGRMVFNVTLDENLSAASRDTVISEIRRIVGARLRSGSFEVLFAVEPPKRSVEANG
jgi:uncharacterized hydrophobic protein (TIGR00271 family)